MKKVLASVVVVFAIFFLAFFTGTLSMIGRMSNTLVIVIVVSVAIGSAYTAWQSRSVQEWRQRRHWENVYAALRQGREDAARVTRASGLPVPEWNIPGDGDEASHVTAGTKHEKGFAFVIVIVVIAFLLFLLFMTMFLPPSVGSALAVLALLGLLGVRIVVKLLR